jgi:hypothetical protein
LKDYPLTTHLFLKETKPMATNRQTLANRINAKRSTGPKTEGGRRRSKENARKHDLTSENVTLYYESDEDYADLSRGLVEAMQPTDALEEHLVGRMITSAWRQLRATRMEPELYAAEKRALEDEFVVSEMAMADRHEDRLSALPLPDEQQTATTRDMIMNKRRAAGRLSLVNEKEKIANLGNIGDVVRRLSKGDPIATLMRYEITASRAFYLALHELERLRARKRGEIVIAPIAIDHGD